MHRCKVALTRRRLIGLVATISILAGTSGLASAGPANQAEAVVERLVGQLFELLSTNGIESEQGRQQLGRALQQEADLERLGRLVLGRHWRQASEDQLAEYQALFRDFMLRKFTGHLGSFAGSDLGPAEKMFHIKGSQQLSDQDIIVRSEVRPPEREPLDVAWRLRERDGGPVIIDVVVEGVSLLVSQRSEFSAVIDRQGMDGLLAELRARLARAES